MSKEEAKKELIKLVELYKDGQKYWDTKSESDIGFHLIEPLFEKVLGWNKLDITKEERVLNKRADYTMKLANEDVLVVEAKKTSISLNEEEGRQVVSYAYHKKAKFAVLTNFKNLIVYHALSNIKNVIKNQLKIGNSFFRLNFEELLDKFNILWLLSKESFEKKEINKLLSAKDERLYKPIDKHILDDLLKIREWLSKELKSKKPYLEDQIDEIVQILIDRLIFIRSVEDRGLENRNYLKIVEAKVRNQDVSLQLFPYLIEEFKRFNKNYDSHLFETGLLEKEGAFSDEVLRKVILALYSGTEGLQEDYQFDKIPGDLFGSIYEQYLGTILQATEKRVKLEGGSGKRKKMGIYYTPSYIVDYIVKNTVGEYIKNRMIDEILEIRIVDPACGSGSFLTRAFKEICNEIEKRLNSGEKSNKYQGFQNISKRLNLSQKATILKGCIYGVDLDEKAVELTQLNLLLKILEDEDSSLPNKRLPNLLSNVKNGNSLIDDSRIARDKAFKWEAQFPEVFRNDGFDVVIGNPPYVRIQEIEEKDATFLTATSKVSEGYLDTYMLFTEKSINLLKKRGLFSFIMPNKFMTSNYGKGLRRFILENVKIKGILDFGDLPVFENASTYPAVYIFEKGEKSSSFNYIKVKNLVEAVKGNLPSPNIIEQKILSSSSWLLGSSENTKLISKLNQVKNKLSDISEKIFQGLITSADNVFILIEKKGQLFSEALGKPVKVEKEILKSLIKGLEIKRYSPLSSQRFLIFPYKKKGSKYVLIEEKELINQFPMTYQYLKENSLLLKSRTDVRNDKIRWYSFSRPQNLEEFENKKIVTPFNAFKNSFTIDIESKWFFTAGVAGGYGLVLKKEIDEEALLSVLNSRLIEFFIKNTSTYLRGFYYSYENRFIKAIPIILPDKKQEQIVVGLVNQMLELQKRYHKEGLTGNEKERLEQQIKNIDYEIDQEVYKLYGLTKEEINIVEESLK